MLGVDRRQMTAIGHVGEIDRRFEVSVKTRNWITILEIADMLPKGSSR